MNSTGYRVVASALFALALCAGAEAGASATWKAGAARLKLTPKENLWLEGYASRTNAMTGVLHDVWAKALAIEDGEGRTGLIVTLDVCGIGKDISDRIRGEIGRRFGLKRDSIIINTSHTHTGPNLVAEDSILQMPPEDIERTKAYVRWFEGAVVDVSGEALANRRPARIFSGNGTCRFAVNRRCNAERELKTTTEQQGVRDYAVPVLKAVGTDGREIAILFGYACHNTTLGIDLMSGDYAGFAQTEVEMRHPDAVAMFFQGAGGDQNPLPRNKPSLAVQYGRQLAASVEQALEDEMSERKPVLKTAYSDIVLPFDAPLTDEELREKVEAKADWRYMIAKRMLEARARGEKEPREYPAYPVEVWDVGGQKIVALGGEIVVGYAVELKRRYGYDVFVMGYCNDVMNYMPTPELWDRGTYEGNYAHFAFGLPTRWRRDVMYTILSEVARLMESVR